MKMIKWERKPLGTVADLCLGKMLDQNKNRGESLPYLANVNVRWGEFALDDLRTMRFEPKEMDRYGLKFGDIVMCEGGEPGRCAIWKDQVPGMMIQKALHRIRPKELLDYRFLFYSFLPIAADAATKRKREINRGSFPQSGCYGLLTALRTPHVENSRSRNTQPGALALSLSADKHI